MSYKILRKPLAALAICATLCLASRRLHAQTSDTVYQLVLTSKIDSKSAKVGDPVTARTVYKMEINGVPIPPETKLTGKITAATHQPPSVSFALDSVEKKGQPPIPIEATLVSIGPPAPDNSSSSFGPPSRGGYTQATPIATNTSGFNNDLPPQAGSTIKNITLHDDALTSNKDFKIENKSRLAVTLEAKKQ
jgi:hypothetical protein